MGSGSPRKIWKMNGRPSQLTYKNADSRVWKEVTKIWEKFKEQVTRAEHRQGGILESMVIPEEFRWSLTRDGMFSTATAYKWLKGEREIQGSSLWKGIWKLQVPERVRVFMWLVSHKRLATGKITAKWGELDGRCIICQNEEEDILHALRDCQHTRMTWQQLIPMYKNEEFFNEDWNGWLQNNLSGQRATTESYRWVDLFAVTYWHIWHWRNLQIHDSEFSFPTSTKKVITGYLESYNKKWYTGEMQDIREELILILGVYPRKAGAN